MAFGFGKKKKKDDVEETQDGTAPVAEATEEASETSEDAGADKKKKKKGFEADPKKARRFFEHAKTVADSGNYDYSVECYINGLRHSPDSLQYHEALQEVSIRRKVKGGKPAGKLEEMKLKGNKGLEKMLKYEFLWAKDPENARHALTVMETAHSLELDEVAHWMGQHVMMANRGAKKPDKQIFLKLRDLYEKLGDLDMAVEACQLALKMDSQNMELVRQLRDLQTEQSMKRANYDSEKGFLDSVKDIDKQQELANEDAIAKTSGQKQSVLDLARQGYESDPKDIDAIIKYARALESMETMEHENKACEVLKAGFEVTGQFRLKIQMGNIRMKQFKRKLRELKDKVNADPQNEAAIEKFNEVRAKQVQFELNEFTERAKAYPTDMSYKYELGRRQFLVEDYDNAISSFQEAQTDPKHRAQALYYLGASFARREWYDEAVDTFKRGIENHDISDDMLGLNLRYELVLALEKLAARDRNLEVAEEAAKRASGIAMSDINYKDIRDRVDAIRKLIADIRQND